MRLSHGNIPKTQFLFYVNVIRGVDDKQSCYNDVEERRALEETARKIWG